MMRTATDFNEFYKSADPWKLTKAAARDRIYRRLLSPIIRNKRVLELGCGEGHLTNAVFDEAASIKGIDISEVAISRARQRTRPNAEFQCSDFLAVPFADFDVICAIECLNYLSTDERTLFFEKLCSEHHGKPFIFSNPIIGGNYFLHSDLLKTFEKFQLRLVGFHNLNVYWKPTYRRIIANLVKVPVLDRALDLLPEKLIYQRLYVLETSR
jgi:SAM-dependent methyltransferase